MAAIGLTVVLAGAAAAPLLFTSSSPTSAAPVLTPHTLLRLPAASALAQGDGAAYVTDDLRDLLLRFDPGSGRVEGSVHLAGRPTAMVLDGRDLWVADMVDNQVVEVDARTLHIVRSVSVPAGPSGLAVLGPHVWVTSVVANEITAIDTRTGATGIPVDVVGGAVRVAAGFGALWITGTADMLTYFVPPSAAARTPKLEGITVGNGPIGVAAGAGSVWVADAQGGTVSQVDPRLPAGRAHRPGGWRPPQRRRGGGQGLRRRRHGADAAHRVSLSVLEGARHRDDAAVACSRSADRYGWRAPIREGCSRSARGERTPP